LGLVASNIAGYYIFQSTKIIKFRLLGAESN
jgi:hypothetical protein